MLYPSIQLFMILFIELTKKSNGKNFYIHKRLSFDVLFKYSILIIFVGSTYCDTLRICNEMDDHTDKANPYIVAVDGFVNVNLFLNKILKIDKLIVIKTSARNEICPAAFN
jgi:hypothetical protein